MSKAPERRVLIREINFVWYPLTLIPLLALFYFSFNGALPSMVGLLALFLTIFWISSLGFALYAKFRKPPTLRQ